MLNLSLLETEVTSREWAGGPKGAVNRASVLMSVESPKKRRTILAVGLVRPLPQDVAPSFARCSLPGRISITGVLVYLLGREQRSSGLIPANRVLDGSPTVADNLFDIPSSGQLPFRTNVSLFLMIGIRESNARDDSPPHETTKTLHPCSQEFASKRVQHQHDGLNPTAISLIKHSHAI